MYVLRLHLALLEPWATIFAWRRGAGGEKKLHQFVCKLIADWIIGKGKLNDQKKWEHRSIYSTRKHVENTGEFLIEWEASLSWPSAEWMEVYELVVEVNSVIIIIFILCSSSFGYSFVAKCLSRICVWRRGHQAPLRQLLFLIRARSQII